MNLSDRQIGRGGTRGCLTSRVLTNQTGNLSLTPPLSNRRPALLTRHAHPAVTMEESVGPSGLPGPQLRLASIWPDRENTSQLKNKSNNGWTD